MSTICYDILQDAVQVQEICGLLDRLSLGPLEIKGSESQRLKEFKNMVATNQHQNIIKKLFTEIDFVLSKATDAEIRNFFAVFTTLILKINKKGPWITDIVVRLQENTTEKTVVRLQVLVDLYNLDAELSRKYVTLLAILNYSTLTQQGESIFSQFRAIDEWEKELQLTVEQLRELCLSLIRLLRNKKESLPIFALYLKSFDKETDLVIENAFETIQQLVINTIKTSDVHHVDILNLRAIVTFKDKPLFKLVEIFTHGQCRVFKDYFSNLNFLSQADFDLLLEKIRILTITSIFSSKQVVSFSEISAALDIDVDDVEAWVVDVASRNLVSVRIDQPQKQINVKYSAKRSFDEKDWISLGNRVSNCRENISSLLETVRRAKQATNDLNSDK